MCFALDPRFIMLDEPTSGVSTRDKRTVMDIITGVVKKKNASAIIVEHDMDIVFSYTQRVVALFEGTVLADGKPEEIQQSAEVASKILGV